jgi:hypothetical protein
MGRNIKVKPKKKKARREGIKEGKKYSPSILTHLGVIYLHRTVTDRSQTFPIRREPDAARDTMIIYFHSIHEKTRTSTYLSYTKVWDQSNFSLFSFWNCKNSRPVISNIEFFREIRVSARCRRHNYTLKIPDKCSNGS